MTASPSPSSSSTRRSGSRPRERANARSSKAGPRRAASCRSIPRAASKRRVTRLAPPASRCTRSPPCSSPAPPAASRCRTLSLPAFSTWAEPPSPTMQASSSGCAEGGAMADFRALMLREADGKVAASIEKVSESALPPGEVTVGVAHSTLNYKDGLILNGLGRLVRQYPHVPGIDFAGTVEHSESAEFRPGDQVILTGWRVGEVQWGGYAEKARVKAAHLVKLPEGLTTKRAMAIGTAGFTAMLAIMALEEHGVSPARGEVLVTGAAGGVGSIAVAVLAKLGYAVAASTGRPEQGEYLRRLGAQTLVERAALAK